jgi:hypothetical protein
VQSNRRSDRVAVDALREQLGKNFDITVAERAN